MMINSLSSLGSSHTKFFTPPVSGFAGRIQFNGANYLTKPTTQMNLGTGTFTIEFWIRNNASNSGGTRGIVGFGTDTTGFAVCLNGAGATSKINLQTAYSGSYNTFASSVNFPFNTTWQHIALTRDSGGIFRIFQNGTATYTSVVAITTNLFGAGIAIGRQYLNIDGNYMTSGSEVTGIRISNLCLYTATFTPTSSPYTVTANDALICNFDSASTFLDTQGYTNYGTLTNTGAVTYVAGYP